MFKTVFAKHYGAIHILQVEDTDFRYQIDLRGNNANNLTSVVVELTKLYARLNKPVPPNIARLYMFWYRFWRGISVGQFITSHLEEATIWIDDHYPELNFKNKYYPCIVRQITQLQFGKSLGKNK